MLSEIISDFAEKLAEAKEENFKLKMELLYKDEQLKKTTCELDQLDVAFTTLKEEAEKLKSNFLQKNDELAAQKHEVQFLETTFAEKVGDLENNNKTVKDRLAAAEDMLEGIQADYNGLKVIVAEKTEEIKKIKQEMENKLSEKNHDLSTINKRHKKEVEQLVELCTNIGTKYPFIAEKWDD